MAEINIKLVNGELAGKTFQEIKKSVNAAANELNKAKVGTDEWIKATQKLDNAKKLQEDYTRQLKATTAGSDALKKSFGGVLQQIPGFNQLSGAVSSLKGGVGGLTSGFGFLRGAIISTGIGALVIAIVGLVSWFTKTEKGANIVSGAFKGMGAVIDTLMGRLWNIGDTLKQLFSNPIEFFKNLGKDIANAAKDGYDLVQVFDDIEDRQRALDVHAKQNENTIDQLLLQSKNVATSYRERIALLDQADALTRKSYKDQLDLSNEYLAAVEREITADLKQHGFAIKAGEDLLLNENLQGESADKLRDARLKVLELEGQRIEMEEKIQNRRDQILKKEEKGQDARIEKEKKVTSENKKEKEEQLEDYEKFIQREIEAINREWEAKHKANELGYSEEVGALNERYLQGALSEDNYLLGQKGALLEYHRSRVDLIRKQFGEESLEYQNAYNEFIGIQIESGKLMSDLSDKQTQNIIKGVNDGLTAFGNIFGGFASQYEQGTRSWKNFAKAQAIVSAIQGSINAYASTSAIPVIGPGLAPFAAGAALAAGLAQVKKIEATEVKSPVEKKKAARGFVLRGPSHSRGGIPIEAEGDEMILAKGVYRNPMLRQIASWANVQAGGIPLAETGMVVPTNPFDRSRASITSGNAPTASSISGDPIGIDRLEARLVELTMAMERRIDRIQVNNNLQDTQKGLQTLQKLREEADL